MTDRKLAAQFARLLEGRPKKAIAAFTVLISLVGGGLYYLSAKQTDVEGERCKVACATEGKLFIYLPDQMTDGYPYSRLSPNCTCYGSFKSKEVGAEKSAP